MGETIPYKNIHHHLRAGSNPCDQYFCELAMLKPCQPVRYVQHRSPFPAFFEGLTLNIYKGHLVKVCRLKRTA